MNLEKIELLMIEEKPTILACSEARLTNEIGENEYNVEGYESIICPSLSRHTGGVAMYIKQPLKYKVIQNDLYENSIWYLSIELSNKKSMGLYHVFYRSPQKSCTYSEIKMVDQMLNKIVNNNKLNIIMGDLNIDLNKQNSYTKSIENMLNKHGLVNKAKFNTRISANSASKRDVVWTNENDRVTCEPIQNEISDHETIRIKINSMLVVVEKSFKVISWKNYSKERLMSEMHKSNFIEIWHANEDEKIAIMRSEIQSAVENKEIILKRNNIKWFNDRLRELKLIKKEAYSKWKTHMTQENYVEYKNKLNTYNKEIKIEKCNYNQRLIQENINNQQSLWRILRNIISEKPTKPNEVIIFDGIECSLPSEICNKLNKFFTSSIMEINSKIPTIERIEE